MGRWATYRLLRRLTSSAIETSIPIKPHTLFSFCSDLTSQSRCFRPFSSLPSQSAALAVDFDYGSRYFGQNYAEEVHSNEDGEEAAKIPVKAFFSLQDQFVLVSSYPIPCLNHTSKCYYGFHIRIRMPKWLVQLPISINLRSMQAQNAGNVVPPTSRTANYITLRFCDILGEVIGTSFQSYAICYRYMVVFQYGSAVLFNVEDHEVDIFLDIVKRHASGLLPEMRKDDYTVKEKPTLAEDMQGGADYIILKNLDTDAIRIIGSVLGQSIALDHFVSQVDIMVEEFADINREMEKTGNFNMRRKKLFQLVGKANSNLADIILKVGLFDRSEIAWRKAKYAQINEYLREEYEVTQRFGNLDIKLKFVEHNIHFLQEVLQNRRSDLLEWCIIILLSIENFISLYEIVRDSAGGSV